MKFLTLFTLLVLVSCGKDHSSSSHKAAPVETELTFIGEASNDPRLQGVEFKLDLSKLNQEVAVQSVLGSSVCNKSLGNNNTVQDTGVTEGHVIVQSSNNGASGLIKFSHLAYYDPTGNDQLCALFSKESYNFTYDGTILTIFAIAPGKAWDGAASTFLKQ